MRLRAFALRLRLRSRWLRPTVIARSASTRGGRSARRSARPAPRRRPSPLRCDCGRSTTGTATAPRRREGRDPVWSHAAADRDAGTPASAPGAPRQRRLAERGLRVDLALAGDHEVRAAPACRRSRWPPSRARRPGRSANDRNRSCERQQREPDAAGRARRRASRARAGRWPPRARRPRRRAARRARATCSGVAPFCGSVRRGGARRAQQRVRDVAGDRELDSARRGSRPSRSTAGRPIGAERLEQSPRRRRSWRCRRCRARSTGRRRRARLGSPRRSRTSSRARGSRSSAASAREPRRLGHLDDRRGDRRSSGASAR